MSKEFAKDIEECLKQLRKDGTILYPTDTVWGLGCDPTNDAAVDKIVRLKNRPENKSFIVLVDSTAMLQKYVTSVDEKIINFLKQVNKPTTIIYPEAIGLSKSVLGKNGSVAIRICNDDFCKSLIAEFGKPIVSTSANISGEPAPRIFPEINPEIVRGVDYAVDYRRDDDKLAAPSAIFQWIHDELKIIRE